MLTGALPQGEYQPASVLAGSDVRYDAIIARALQYDRELRYQSARELRRDLDDIIATPVIKEGDVTGRAAIPKQFVHRRAVNAPVYRPPAAPSYTEVPVPRNYADVFWFMIIVAVLAGGVYVWKKQERYKQSLPKTPIVAAPRQHPSAADVKMPSNSQDPVVGNSPGKPDSPTSSPTPQQPSSGSDIASGTWTVVHDAQGGSKLLASRDVNFGPECHDGAIRATIAANASSKDWVHVELRCDKEGNRYDFILKPTGFAVIGYLRSGAKGEVVKQVEYDASIRRSEYAIELRAVGRKLTGLVNGVEMLSVEDDRISNGCFGIESKFLDSYREVAYLSLDQSNPSQNITAAPVSSAPGTDSRLPKIEVEFREAYDRDIIRPHEVAVADLNTKYLAALGRADAAAIQSGKSDESLRLKEEIQRVQNKQPIPATEVEPVPASLKQLRVTYADALAKIDHEWDVKSRSSYDQLNRQLDELQKRLLEEGHTDEAQLIKTKRDQIADNITRP